MLQIEIAKQNINMVSVVESSGVQLSYKYGRHVGLCPFHDDQTPSFFVFPDNHFKCFGCGAHGDVIDFIRSLHGFDFKEACQFLGIDLDKPSKEFESKIVQYQQQREKKKRYQQRERDLAYTLGTLIRWTHTAMGAIKTIADLEAFDDVLYALPFRKHCHHILCQGDAEERKEVVEALRDIEIIEREPLFEPGFDYRGWLSHTIAVDEKRSADGIEINLHFE